MARERFDGVFRTDDPDGFAMAVRDSLSVPVDLSNPRENPDWETRVTARSAFDQRIRVDDRTT